ncbi:MAG: M20/M25/M40 family metallo-hydrolase [Bacteroidales bacterium]
MKKLPVALLAFMLLPVFLIAQVSVEITAGELEEHVRYLASDELMGRKAGTRGDTLAAGYIRSQFEHAGLQLLESDGYQYFDVVTDVALGQTNRLQYEGIAWEAGEDFIPYAFSAADVLTAPAVFAGFGLQVQNDTLEWDDYKTIDAKGRWVILLSGFPDPDQDQSAFAGISGIRDKVIAARDQGAVGVIVVSGEQWDPGDRLPSLYFDRAGGNTGIPVIHVKRHVADTIISGTGHTLAQLEARILDQDIPFSFAIPGEVTAATDIHKVHATTRNVIAMVPGSDPELRKEYLVVGAHYDHLGMGGPGSGSRNPDTLVVHNGADDNASGVSGIIEIAENLSLRDNRPKRSIVFVAFGAEEMGLLGSGYFVENPPVPLEQIQAMINFDMIGRLDPEKRSVMVGGTGTSVQGAGILDRLQEGTALVLSYSPEGYGPSDHAVFYGENIPVFFFNTGVHSDYHTMHDDAGLLNYEGQAEVSAFACRLIAELASREENLIFTEAGPRKKVSNYRQLKVTLGIMPDFTDSSGDGLGVGGVREDGPADAGGMKKGDLITALDGKPVHNIYEYMNRLKKLEPGQIITVDILRDGEKKVLIVQL